VGAVLPSVVSRTPEVLVLDEEVGIVLDDVAVLLVGTASVVVVGDTTTHLRHMHLFLCV